MLGTRIQQATRQIPSSMAEVEQMIKRVPGLEQAGKQLANSIHSAVLQGGSLTRTIADALHGTWFGHPLHPALTDIPIGAWVLAAGWAGRRSDLSAQRRRQSCAAGHQPDGLDGGAGADRDRRI